MPVWVKICGITRMSDAEAAIVSGADAIGLNFVPQSVRLLTPADARPIAEACAARVTRIGLFLDAPLTEVHATLAEVPLDLVQFHGNESAEYCRAYSRTARQPYIKAVPVRGPPDLTSLMERFPDAWALLLDTWADGKTGGTGQVFDWTLWPKAPGVRLILAGGLTPDNVAGAVRTLQPWGVDVSGGVEGATRGHKDPERIRQFITEVRSAGSERAGS